MPGDSQPRLIFLLGGARSGKSAYAESWAREHGERVLFVATAQALDDEMRERIAHHRAGRPDHWDTVEAPLHVERAAAEKMAVGVYDTVVVDCITLLAANVLLTLPEGCSQDEATTAVMRETDALLGLCRQPAATWLMVSNEVGMGVVPPTKLGRFFRDALGRANQQIARAADEVILLVAGLPWRLKP